MIMMPRYTLIYVYLICGVFVLSGNRTAPQKMRINIFCCCFVLFSGRLFYYCCFMRCTNWGQLVYTHTQSERETGRGRGTEKHAAGDNIKCCKKLRQSNNVYSNMLRYKMLQKIKTTQIMYGIMLLLSLLLGSMLLSLLLCRMLLLVLLCSQ